MHINNLISCSISNDAFYFCVVAQIEKLFFFSFESCRISCIKEHVPFCNNNTHHHHHHIRFRKWYGKVRILHLQLVLYAIYFYLYTTYHQSSSAKRPITCKCPKNAFKTYFFSSVFLKMKTSRIKCCVNIFVKLITYIYIHIGRYTSLTFVGMKKCRHFIVEHVCFGSSFLVS